MSNPAASASPLPPGALAGANDLLQWAIRTCGQLVSKSPDLRAEALVLVGSMARGEASVLETENGLKCLSDMEFLLAVRDDRKAKQRMAAVQSLTEQVTHEASCRGLECTFEFSPMLVRCFRNPRPSIFAAELSRHGQVVWGDPAILKPRPDVTVPKIDALYLLSNRMVEQLASWLRLSADDCHEADAQFSYGLVKTYVDLGTSLLVFADSYESTYARRVERLDSLRRLLSGEIEDFDAIHERIVANSLLKLRPERRLLEPLPKDVAFTRWAELARFVLRVWRWEVRQLAQGPAMNETAQVEYFARNCSPWECFREWAKLARLALLNKHTSDLQRAKYLSGSPRNRLYVEAAVNYAKLAGLDGEFPFALSNTKNFLPIHCRAPLSTEQSTAEITRIWNVYFRNT